MKTKLRKTEFIRFRCDPILKAEFEKIALLQGLDASDIGRMALTHFIRQHTPSMPQLIPTHLVHG